jgi:hypothetical protein
MCDLPFKDAARAAVRAQPGKPHPSAEAAGIAAPLAKHRFPLKLVTTRTFGLAAADTAIQAVGGAYSPDVIDESLLPGS